MNAGGTVLIIIVLSSFHDGSQDVFGGQNEDHAGHETIHSRELQPPFPRKMGMLVDKKVKDKQNTQRRKKTSKESGYVSWPVKKIFLFGLLFFFHVNLLLWSA
jgi:hypothetical protein